MEEIIKTIVVGALTACTMVAVLYVLNCIYMELKRKYFRSKSGIRVVKKGKVPTKKVECLHCHSIIEYDTMKVENEQIMDKYYPYIVCPVCNEQIMLGQKNNNNKEREKNEQVQKQYRERHKRGLRHYRPTCARVSTTDV